MASPPTAGAAPQLVLPRPRVLNYRFLFLAFVVVALLGAAGYALQRYPVHRNASALLERADEAERAGDLPRAAEHLARYLGIRPTDNDALARYGLLLTRTAKTHQQVQ